MWDGVLELDPDFFESYLRFSAVPWESGVLEPKVKEFIYIAVDTAATHLYVPGIRDHIKQALKHGATGAEIMEVIELTSTLGIHAANIGVPILVEELEAAGQTIDRYAQRAPGGDQGRVHREARVLERLLGRHARAGRRVLRRLHPVLLRALGERRRSSPRSRSSSTPPSTSPPRTSTSRACASTSATPSDYGATREEVMEVIEIASVLGIHAATVGVPILIEELAAGDGSAA